MIPIKQSLRTLARFKTYTIINLAGLVLSLSCALILMRYIHQEYTVNHFCPELERTFLMTLNYELRDEIPCIGQVGRTKEYNNILNPSNNPCIENVSDFILLDEDKITVNNINFRTRVLVTDASFTKILPRPVIAGQSAVHTPNDALISQKMSKIIFGSEDPLGKTFQTSIGKTVRIVGIFGEASTKTSFEYDIVIPMAMQETWRSIGGQLVQLYNKEDVKAFNEKYVEPLFLERYRMVGVVFQLAPLSDYYFGNYANDFSSHGDTRSIRILSIVMVMLLLIGVLNYINLHTVLMQRRGRELNIKKVYGVNGLEIFTQLFIENLILSLLALLAVWTIVEIANGVVAYYFDIPIVTNRAFDVAITIGLLIFISLTTTIYPYLRYQFRSVALTLGSIGRHGESLISRRLFMWIQFAICVYVIVFSIYFTRHLHYLLNYELNFTTTNIICCKFFNSFQSHEYYGANAHRKYIIESMEQIEKYIADSPLFIGKAYGDMPLRHRTFNTTFFNDQNKQGEIVYLYGDEEYLKLFGYKLKEGRLWDNEKDRMMHYQLIITESVKRHFNIKDINTEKIRSKDHILYGLGQKDVPWYDIVGVVEDFKAEPLSSADNMYVFMNNMNPEGYLFVRIMPGKHNEAIASLRNLYKKITGSDDFTYSFIEDDVAAMYKSEKLQMRIYITFALIAVFIACLGLFGLSLYDIRQRYREIAIRKINGASKGAIFRLLMRKYVYIIGSAFVVSSAVSYVAIEKYMESFYHRAPLSGWIFVVALLLISVVAYATLWWQVRNAIRLNPAEVIKME